MPSLCCSLCLGDRPLPKESDFRDLQSMLHFQEGLQEDRQVVQEGWRYGFLLGCGQLNSENGYS